MNCFRYLGFTTFEQVDNLTIPQYEILMEAARLRWVDIDYRNHLQAYLNFAVKAEKKVGKNKTRPVYSKFKKFFDYEKRIAEAKTPNKKNGQSKLLGLSKFFKTER